MFAIYKRQQFVLSPKKQEPTNEIIIRLYC